MGQAKQVEVWARPCRLARYATNHMHCVTIICRQEGGFSLPRRGGAKPVAQDMEIRHVYKIVGKLDTSARPGRDSDRRGWRDATSILPNKNRPRAVTYTPVKVFYALEVLIAMWN